MATWKPRSASAYTDLITAILPTGPIWDYLAAADHGAMVRGMADEMGRIDARGGDASLEFTPSTAVELIGEWEALLGLPDPLDPSPPTALADRQAAAHAALIASGGQSAAYYMKVSAALGVAVTITGRPYGNPFVCGISHCGDPLNGRGASFIWRVDGPSATSAALQARLEALITRLSPAHTLVEFTWTA